METTKLLLLDSLLQKKMKAASLLRPLKMKAASLLRPLVSCSRGSSLHTSPALAQQAAPAQDSFFGLEQREMQKTAQRIIDEDINPFVTQWEDEGMYPAAQVFKKLGDAGLLGVNKPVEYGGMGLDFKYNIALNETLGSIHCGGVPMSIAVQTDMATPALARFGSHELKKEFLEPSVLGDKVACLGVSEPGGGSDVAAATTTARRVGDDLVINGQKMWITNAFQADWICLLANTEEGPAHLNKSLICVPMDTPGIHLAKRIDKMNARVGHGRYLPGRREGPRQEHHRRCRYGVHLPDAPVPGGETGLCSSDHHPHGPHHLRDHRVPQTEEGLWSAPAKQPVYSLQTGRAHDGGRDVEVGSVPSYRPTCGRRGRHTAGLYVQAQVWETGERSG